MSVITDILNVATGGLIGAGEGANFPLQIPLIKSVLSLRTRRQRRFSSTGLKSTSRLLELKRS